MRLVWDALDEADAVAESLAALDAIERLRAAQGDELGRAALFGNWTRDYYWLAGRLLERGPAYLASAFEVGERLRARVLLDRLTQAGVPAPAADTGRASAELARLLAAAQRDLAAAGSSRQREISERIALMELERQTRTNREEHDTRDAQDAPAAADAGVLSFASLDAVRAALAPDEAMLWYSVAPWTDLYGDFGGGAWALVVTPAEVTAHRLETRVDLDAQVAAFDGLLRQRATPPEAWTAAARHLGRVLLDRPLATMATTVKRLVIVSDGVLHQLPFEALVSDNEAVLGARYDIATVPSATLWLRLRQAGTRPSGTPALVMADPTPPPTDTGLTLPPLPGARLEARRVADLIGLDASLVRVGAAASEHALKGWPLAETPLLHLAAHARADARVPDRSAVFLSAGGAADDDGWLRPSEIVSLGLRGSLVVLSACESADGALVPGEGLLSLARAFFAGGAGTVVATRWPLRDDDAAAMMEAFYRGMARGLPVDGAMRQARADAIDAGLPAAAWAGFALMGDGGRAPVPAGVTAAWWPRLGLVLLAVVGGLVAVRVAAARARVR